MKTLIPAAAIVWACAAHAADPCALKGGDLVFPKGKQLRVLQYDRPTDTFQIQSFKFPGEGISHVTREVLAESLDVDAARKRAILREPDDMVDAVYTTRTDVATLFARELKARGGCGKNLKIK